MVRWDNIPAQMYITDTELNATQATEIAQLDFINSINERSDYIPDDDEHPEEFRAVHTAQLDNMTTEEPPQSSLLPRSFAQSLTNASRVVPRLMLAPDPNAPYWKKMLSAPPPIPGGPFLATNNYPPYLADDTGGVGTTIYILDNGFDTGIPDLRQTPGGRRVNTHVIPNQITLPPQLLIPTPGKPEGRADPASIGGPGNHGTIMACLAGGERMGVAPRADLYLFKVKGIDKSRWARDQTKLNEMTTLLQEFLDWCTARKIPVVVAAGNLDFRVANTDGNLPQSLSQATDSMIIVGAVDAQGLVINEQLPDPSGLVDLYSPGRDITTPIGNGDVLTASGTSQANAIVVCNLFLYSNSH
ncbi:subtilisin-like protein [Decorospora gaudefroyi]|uniref:Subtilisin-like protein n=1 Tax=Decorospora gaudefroyi TaxID=184978 RepID=A0A6A5JW00_9PLEO|nr:subtilisin-like protein [Decorospora gaudefroyi]